MEIDEWVVEYVVPYQREYVIMGVYQKVLAVPFMNELFDVTRKRFDTAFKDLLDAGFAELAMSADDIQDKFEAEFGGILTKCEKRQDLRNDLRKQGVVRAGADGVATVVGSSSSMGASASSPSPIPDSLVSSLFSPANSPRNNAKRASTPRSGKKQTAGKEKREWDNFKYSKDKEKNLNFNRGETEDDQVERFKAEFLPDENATTNLEFSDDENEENDIMARAEKKRGLLGNLWSTVTGGHLTKQDLQPSMDRFKQLLTSKNVATEIADEICQSVSESLVGKKFGSFESTYTTMRDAMERSLTKILTPNRDIDILRDIDLAKSQGRPYVITMVGVNGVGKSTSLSKIVFWLKNRGHSVVIAACDTFRSGAVEQLKVHARCLKTPLFERGYGKEPAATARDAIQYARDNQIDVVIVDTAGRMQDNKPLMKELAILIEVNKPDLTLFVGEALAGNDGVDQLTTFDRELTYQSSDGKTKQIDGIVLTKYDTIDDKVGSAISMCYSTGHPILFVGVGQTYTDLKRLSVRKVVSQLLE